MFRLSRGPKRPGGWGSHPRRSESIASSIHESRGRSQPSQQYSNEQGLSYRTKRGNSQELDGAAFHRRQDESPPVWQQTANLFDAEQTPYDPLSWNAQLQSKAPGTNTFAVQGNSGCRGELHREEETTKFLESNVTYPHHLMQNQQSFGCGSQGYGTGLSMPWLQASGQVNVRSLLKISDARTVANPDPWSPYNTNDMPHMPPDGNANQEPYNNEASGTSPSTFEQNNSEFSHPAADDLCTCISSYGTTDNAMDDRMLPEYRGPVDYSAADELVFCTSCFGSISVGPASRLRHATPPDSQAHSCVYTSILNTAALSEFDRTAPLDAISNASFPAASPEIQCDARGCSIVFHGVHRKGNLARHKRQKHCGPIEYTCEDPSCDRVFLRKDARLKHYRKWHKGLASPYHARPQSRHTTGEQYFDFASNISS